MKLVPGVNLIGIYQHLIKYWYLSSRICPDSYTNRIDSKNHAQCIPFTKC